MPDENGEFALSFFTAAKGFGFSVSVSRTFASSASVGVSDTEEFSEAGTTALATGRTLELGGGERSMPSSPSVAVGVDLPASLSLFAALTAGIFDATGASLAEGAGPPGKVKPLCEVAGPLDGPGALDADGAVDIVGPVDTVAAGGSAGVPGLFGPVDTVAAGGPAAVFETDGPVLTVAAGGTTGALETDGAVETGGITGTVKVLLLLPGGGGNKGAPKISSQSFLLDFNLVLESVLDGSPSDFDLGSSGIRPDILRSRALGR